MSSALTMRVKLVHQVIVGVHTAQNPAKHEWDRYCLLLESARKDLRALLFYTEGGGPSSAQRQQLRDAMHDTPAPPSAVLTDSVWARGIITSLNWFLQTPIGAFEPENLHDALEHLALPYGPQERDDIVECLFALAREIGVRLPLYDRTSLRAPKRDHMSEG